MKRPAAKKGPAQSKREAAKKGPAQSLKRPTGSAASKKTGGKTPRAKPAKVGAFEKAKQTICGKPKGAANYRMAKPAAAGAAAKLGELKGAANYRMAKPAAAGAAAKLGELRASAEYRRAKPAAAAAAAKRWEQNLVKTKRLPESILPRPVHYGEQEEVTRFRWLYSSVLAHCRSS